MLIGGALCDTNTFLFMIALIVCGMCYTYAVSIDAREYAESILTWATKHLNIGRDFFGLLWTTVTSFFDTQKSSVKIFMETSVRLPVLIWKGDETITFVGKSIGYFTLFRIILYILCPLVRGFMKIGTFAMEYPAVVAGLGGLAALAVQYNSGLMGGEHDAELSISYTTTT
jgi:hypothetical protein